MRCVGGGVNACGHAFERIPRLRLKRAGLLLVAAAGIALAGCSPGTGVSTGAPPLVVCGQTIWTGAAGPVMQDVSGGGTVTIGSSGGNLFLKVSEGCSHGVAVTVSPSGAAGTIASATTSDGRDAAVVLKPNRQDFSLLLRSMDGRTETALVRLDHPAGP